MGKFVLWRALSRIAPKGARLSGYDFEGLASYAQAQFAKVEDGSVRPPLSTGKAGEHE
jgi:hypothetical protein